MTFCINFSLIIPSLVIRRHSYTQAQFVLLSYLQAQKLMLQISTFLLFFFPSIKAFAVPEGFSSASAAQDSKSEDREQAYRAPEIIPMYGVSAKMVPLFQDSGHR